MPIYCSYLLISTSIPTDNCPFGATATALSPDMPRIILLCEGILGGYGRDSRWLAGIIP